MLKVTTLLLIGGMLVLSFFLYSFIFDVDQDSIGAQLLPLEEVDLQLYENLIDH